MVDVMKIYKNKYSKIKSQLKGGWREEPPENDDEKSISSGDSCYSSTNKTKQIQLTPTGDKEEDTSA